MKELIKPNKKEREYGNVEALCERSSCGYDSVYWENAYNRGGYGCYQVTITSDSENSDDILF